jgi:hypothetical protein
MVGILTEGRESLAAFDAVIVAEPIPARFSVETWPEDYPTAGAAFFE